MRSLFSHSGYFCFKFSPTFNMIMTKFYFTRNFSPVCQEGALNCGKRVDPEETAWAVRDSIAERKFITEEVSLVLLPALCILVSNIPERPRQRWRETKQNREFRWTYKKNQKTRIYIHNSLKITYKTLAILLKYIDFSVFNCLTALQL